MMQAIQTKRLAGLETHSFPLDIKREPDEDGVIEGYASVFDTVDNGADIVSRGAFEKSLGSGRKVRMLWQHDWNEPIGVWDELAEDERGLYVKGRILKSVRRGAEAIDLYKSGAMDALSIGYITKDASREGSGVRRLLEVELYEISLVTIPMNDLARAQVKSLETEREFEKFLRDAGLSRKEAKAVTLHGFKGLHGRRDAGLILPDQAELSELQKLIGQLQETFTNV